MKATPAMPDRAILLAAALAASQWACPAYLLSGLRAGADERTDRYAIAPIEADASLRCGRDDCAALQVERTSRDGNSRGLFMLFFGTELFTAAGAAVGAVAVASNNNGGFASSASSAFASIPLWLLAGGATLTAVVDLTTYFVRRGSFERQFDPPRMSRPAYATWKGATVPLDAVDLWPPEQPPPERFSVELAVAAHLKRAPEDRRAAGESPRGRLAVLELRSYAPELARENLGFFADLVRANALRQARGYQVLTRENLLTLLEATGKDLATCEGECEVETGRRIGADVLVTGEVQRVGTKYKLSFKLHETRAGRLLNTALVSGSSIDEIADGVQKAAAELFEPLARQP